MGLKGGILKEINFLMDLRAGDIWANGGGERVCEWALGLRVLVGRRGGIWQRRI